MAVTMDVLDAVGRAMRPLATRVANTVARAVVQLVDDDAKMQLVQLGVLAGETLDGAERFEPYGLTSVPLAGAEAVAVFPNGDRSHPLVIAVADRRFRPTGGDAGDVILYGKLGARVTMLANGDVEIRPAPGHEIFIRDEGGTVDRLVKKSEHDGHTHGAGSFTTPAGGGGGGPVTGVSGGAAAVAGTQRLRVQ